MNDLISLFETDVVAEYRKYFPNSYIKFSKGSLGSTFITLMLTSPNDCIPLLCCRMVILSNIIKVLCPLIH